MQQTATTTDLTSPASCTPKAENSTAFSLDIAHRPRRNRKSDAVRSLLQETRLDPANFVAPLFVVEGHHQKQSIDSMPGVYRLSIDLLLKEAEALLKLGVKAIDLFPALAPEKKDHFGSDAIRDDNLIARSLAALKKNLPELCVMVDIALDPYTNHGHDGLINSEGCVLNDATIEVLGKMSLHAAQAGADVVAPSDMMDGRIGYIRSLLDSHGYIDVSILSYAAKYASAFYGPFRDALQSAPKFGDKKGYQMNPANCREALLECALDEVEGADMLLIKPALPYLDIIAKVKAITNLPVGAYHVSGEYAMVKAAALNGWIDGKRVMLESLLSIKRAGADFIFTYAAREAAEWLREQS